MTCVRSDLPPPTTRTLNLSLLLAAELANREAEGADLTSAFDRRANIFLVQQTSLKECGLRKAGIGCQSKLLQTCTRGCACRVQRYIRDMDSEKQKSIRNCEDASVSSSSPHD